MNESASPQRWSMLVLLALAELLGMSLWFAANAAGPQLQERWALDPGGLAVLTGAVQLGFVVGTALAAVLNLADLWPSRYYLGASALLASAANLSLIVAPGYGIAIATRFLTGFFLAGVYPPGMKMAATWFRSHRGLAIGILVGALAVGKSLPYVVHAIGTPSIEFVCVSTSAAAAIAAIAVSTLYREGPFPFERRPFDWQLVAEVVRHRGARLAIGGYLGHMWELYAMWTWVPAFAAASAVASRSGPAAWSGDVAALVTLCSGGLGCVWGGWASRRLGYARVVTVAMAVSALCCLVIGACFGAGPAVLLPALAVWGFFVVADSAQFSAMVTEAAPRHAVGTALTLQTSLGFLLTMATIQLVPLWVEWVGWRWAFAGLAIGPLLGILAIARLGSSARGS